MPINWQLSRIRVPPLKLIQKCRLRVSGWDRCHFLLSNPPDYLRYLSMISMLYMILSVFSWYPFMGAYHRSFSGRFYFILLECTIPSSEFSFFQGATQGRSGKPHWRSVVWGQICLQSKAWNVNSNFRLVWLSLHLSSAGFPSLSLPSSFHWLAPYQVLYN